MNRSRIIRGIVVIGVMIILCVILFPRKDSQIAEPALPIEEIKEEPENKPKAGLSNPVCGGNKDSSWSGDRIYYGSIEQDGDTSNGTEPILWRVLQVDGTKVFLLSEYALYTMPYNRVCKDTTWETCDVRKWLNGEFINNSFTDTEKAGIIETAVHTDKNPRFGTAGGNDTQDRIFLLQWSDTFNESYGFTAPQTADVKYEIEEDEEDTMEFGDLSIGRLCYPTVFVANQKALVTRQSDVRKGKDGSKVDGYGTIYWILRTPGNALNRITYVSRWGRTTYTFDSPVDHTESTLRPAMWVDLSESELNEITKGYYTVTEDEEYLTKVSAAKDYREEILYLLDNEAEGPTYNIAGTTCSSVEDLSNPVFGGNDEGYWEGDRVYFGKTDGTKILWRVLSTDNGQLLLFSEYSLFSMKFDEDGSNEWSKSSIRSYLNSEFIAQVFTEEEASLLVDTPLTADVDPRYGTPCGEDTADKVFLLSYFDIMNESYGFTGPDPEYGNGPTDSNTRVCYTLNRAKKLEGLPTTTVYARYDKDGNPINVFKDYGVMWTTRTAGFSGEHLHSVNRWGDGYLHEMRGSGKKVHIRPALVINKSDVILKQNNDNKYPIIKAK